MRIGGVVVLPSERYEQTESTPRGPVHIAKDYDLPQAALLKLRPEWRSEIAMRRLALLTDG